MPLADFPADKIDAILVAVAMPTPPPEYVAYGPVGSPSALCLIDNRAWWEWHWFRGIDPERKRKGAHA